MDDHECGPGPIARSGDHDHMDLDITSTHEVSRDEALAVSTYEEEVTRLRMCSVAKSSRYIYNRSSAKMLEWLYNYKPALLTPSCKAKLDPCADAPERMKKIQQIFDSAPTNPPLRFDKLTARNFMTWIVSLRKPDGKELGPASFDGHRSGLFNLFRDFGFTMSKELESELKTHFKGLKKESAKNVADGQGKIKVGKDPLSFSLYQHISREMMKSNKTDIIFARCFLTLCWNLMSRAENTARIHLNHLEWQEDALGVFFSQMKNDQNAERPRDPRHVYANPIIPEVCPVLALGIYWLCFDYCYRDFQASDDHDIDESKSPLLFPGSNQYERFRKILRRCTESVRNISSELERRGICFKDIGTHSIRKGSATYCSSGTTSCPSSIAIYLRAGWKLGGVQDRYFRYESAGDQYVGRVVSGLPPNEAEFAVLPPFFDRSSLLPQKSTTSVLFNGSTTVNVDDMDIDGVHDMNEGPANITDKAVKDCFPFISIQANLKFVAEQTLASVVYHSKFLRDNLPEYHPLFESVLFGDDGNLLDSLKKLVVCRLGRTTDPLTPTGVPAHVCMMAKLEGIAHRIDRQLKLQVDTTSTLADSVVEKMDRRVADHYNTVTKADVVQCLQDAGITEIVSDIRDPKSKFWKRCSGVPVRESKTDDCSDSLDMDINGMRKNGIRKVYFWGGLTHLVPEDFQFPSGGTAAAWVQWCCGHSSKGYPPLRLLIPKDLTTSNQKKRLSDLKYLMKKVEERAKAVDETWSAAGLTASMALETFQKCEDSISIDSTTARGRVRRRGQLKWTTHSKIMREHESSDKSNNEQA